jgi:predicted RNase H-like HicB family nuclease
MRLGLTVEIWQKGNWYVARCPELDFVTQGASVAEARQNLLEVIQIQFEEMKALGTLEDYLAECGYKRCNGSFVPQSDLISFEKSTVQVL